MKIGLLGGSFDPLHFGHLNLAIEMLEKHQLDQVWFCPAKINPLKQASAPKEQSQERWKMLKIALDEIPAFKVLDLEVNREGPSYTVETLESLHRDYPNYKFYLILGDDAIPHFFKWHKPEEITSLATLLIGTRSLADLPSIQGSPLIKNAIKEGVTETKVMDISSTEIRKRLKCRKFCGHLVPSKILDYIYEHGLYL